jgi:DNA-binding response OmpR family regulator
LKVSRDGSSREFTVAKWREVLYIDFQEMDIKIVVVDDDRLTISLLENVLADHLFSVFSAPDGQTGLELVQKEKPNILISDLVLPKVDGIELCKRVKQDPDLSQTKVILMSAVYMGSALRPIARDCGADEYIAKPLNSTNLLEKIYKLCAETAAGEKEKPS